MPQSLRGIGGSANAAATPDARNAAARSPRHRSLVELAADDPDLFQKELDRIASDTAGSREQTRLGAEAIEGAGAPGRAAMAAAVPASFLGGPLGLAAGALLTTSGLADAYEDPNALNVGMSLAGVTPAVRALRGLRNGAQAVQRYTGGAANVLRGADATGDVLSRVRTGSGRGITPGPVGIADDGLRASSYGASASDDVLTGAAQYGDFARRAPAAGGRTGSAYRAGTAADDVAGAQRRADDYAEQFMDDLPQVDEFDIVDDVVPDQGMPSMDAIDNLISGMSNVRPARAVRGRQLDAKLGEQIADFQQRRRHGVGGFSSLPEMSASEVDRISANIDRVRNKYR